MTSSNLPQTRIVTLDKPTLEMRPMFWRRLIRNRLAVLSLIGAALLLAAAILGPSVYTVNPNTPDYGAINAFPTAAHWFGGDNLGRDTLARVLYGLRVSLIVAMYVEALNILLGATLGLLAGYFGGLLDVIVTRIADVLFAFPGLLLAILVAALFGPVVTERFGGIGRLLLVAGSLSLVSWPLMARFVRSQTLSLREQDFVSAARSLGASSTRIIIVHILPNVLGLIIVSSTLDIASVVVNEAVLSLLGLGIQPPDPSIGKMITDAIPFLEANPLQVLFPSLALMLIVLTVSFLEMAFVMRLILKHLIKAREQKSPESPLKTAVESTAAAVRRRQSSVPTSPYDIITWVGDIKGAVGVRDRWVITLELLQTSAIRLSMSDIESQRLHTLSVEVRTQDDIDRAVQAWWNPIEWWLGRLTIYRLQPGKTYRVLRAFTDHYNTQFEVDTQLTFLEQSFLPYHGGYTVNFQQMTLYLQEKENAQILDHFDEYFEVVSG